MSALGKVVKIAMSLSLCVPNIRSDNKYLHLRDVDTNTLCLTQYSNYASVLLFDMSLFPALLGFFHTLFAPRLELLAENLALRQQIAVLNRTAKRPKLRSYDRLFWATLSSLWNNWRSALIIIKPETVVRWHRDGFRLYWRWKSKARNSGRPKVDAEIRDLIRRMSQENPLWGSPRIQAELKLLGFNVAESTVAKYRVKVLKPPSQTWKPFLSNHAGEIVAIDFFIVPTVTFRNLYCFIILLHARR